MLLSYKNKMSNFKKISEIQVDEPDSWQDKMFLTFDVDWAHDDVLSDTIDIVENAGVSATWFVTHDTPVLERLRHNDSFELGIHPNFNFLMNGSNQNGRNLEEVVERVLEIVPDAKSVRSHSMLQNTPLLEMFKSKGLTHECNHFIPEQSGVLLKPWRLWNDLTKVPYFWEDDLVCKYEDNNALEALVKRDGLKVFDFHPIHVFLNTESMERYNNSRDVHKDPQKLKENRLVDGDGSRVYLNRLIDLCTK